MATREDAIAKFQEWRKVEKGFIFQSTDGSWNCCSAASPIGSALANMGAGEGAAAHVKRFEAISNTPEGDTMVDESAALADAVEQEAAPTAHHERHRSAKTRGFRKTKHRGKALLVFGLILAAGGFLIAHYKAAIIEIPFLKGFYPKYMSLLFGVAGWTILGIGILCLLLGIVRFFGKNKDPLRNGLP